MGKFSDTKYINTIDNLVSATKDKINNPYYKFSDKKPTKVTYYTQNVEKSTLDEASGLYEAHLGSKSPFKFNKIKDFVLYGIDRINVEYDVGEFGTESNPITGNCILLPNTIVPKDGDFFSISYVKENLLFKVNSISPDTLDNGANIYSIEYALEKVDMIDTIESQVAKTYRFIVDNIGTEFKAIIQDCDYDLIDNLEALVDNLIIKFTNIFFNDKLQTFVCNHDGWNMYDPFLIEFMKRNNILSFGEEYVYVSHATCTNKTFGMDYLKTFFYALENPTKRINYNTTGTADLIQDPNSLFSTRLQEYYMINHVDYTPYKIRINLFDMDVVEHIRDNKMYVKDDEKEYYNLWIAYFNNNDDFIKEDLIDLLNKIEFMDNLKYFYALPIAIFIIEKGIMKLLAR